MRQFHDLNPLGCEVPPPKPWIVEPTIVNSGSEQRHFTVVGNWVVGRLEFVIGFLDSKMHVAYPAVAKTVEESRAKDIAVNFKPAEFHTQFLSQEPDVPSGEQTVADLKAD